METSPTSVSTSDNFARIDVLDGARSLAVVLMIIWHFLFDLDARGIGSIIPTLYPWRLIRSGAVHTFLFIAGVCTNLSGNNLRRGGKLCAFAMGVSLVMGLIGDPVLFGILHLMGVCTLLWTWWKPKKSLAAALLCLGFFALLLPWLPHVRMGFDGLFWLGLRSQSFYSSDYYPLFPWGLLFFAGAFGGEWVCKKLRGIALPRWSTWIGRNALIIYLAHQPLLIGGIWLWQKLA